MIFGQTPRDYWNQLVIPNVESFQADRTNIANAVNAAHALSDFADHVWTSKEPNEWAQHFPPNQGEDRKQAFYRNINQQCPGQREIRAASNSIKHKNGRVTITTMLEWGEADFPFERATFSWGESAEALLIRNDTPAPIRPLNEHLEQSMEFWPTFLQQHGLWENVGD
jgi:hypothetical protein